MRATKRFAILASALVALNIVLWLAPAGLALRPALVAELFGPSLIRSEVVVQSGAGGAQDYRIDRGLVTAASSTQITLSEVDGTVETVRLAATTQFVGITRARVARLVRRQLQVLVVRPVNGAAASVEVEGRFADLQGRSRLARQQ